MPNNFKPKVYQIFNYQIWFLIILYKKKILKWGIYEGTYMRFIAKVFPINNLIAVNNIFRTN